MDWWILELIVVGVLIAVVAILGPLIRRFGRAYAADVFQEVCRAAAAHVADFEPSRRLTN